MLGGGRDRKERIDRVAGWIRGSEVDVEGFGGVTVLTGAGVSTDSGIPDFRGPDGFWTKNPEAEKLATIDVYMSDAEVRARSWRWRAEHPAWDAVPNEAHEALVELEGRGYLQAVVTQNIDGLHQEAGSDPARVVEVHGSMREVECTGCDRRLPTQEVLSRVREGEEDPRCRECGSIMKTATVFFGEGLDPLAVERAQLAANVCDVFIAAGTSLQVYPVAWLPSVARGGGARVVIINAEPTPHDDEADLVIHGGVGEILPAIAERI